MGALSRTRGATFEREVCSLLSDHLGVKVRRILGQERDSGSDVRCGRWLIEAKRRRSLALVYGWLRQVEAAAEPGQPAAVVFRADGEQPVVMLRLPDFVRIAREELV